MGSISSDFFRFSAFVSAKKNDRQKTGYKLTERFTPNNILNFTPSRGSRLETGDEFGVSNVSIRQHKKFGS